MIAGIVFLTTVIFFFSGYFPGSITTDSQSTRTVPLTSYLGNTTHPSWNPDGSMFAFGHTEKGDMNIYVKSVEEGEPHQLTDNPADDLGPCWSPTGDKIAYYSDRGKGTETGPAPTSDSTRKGMWHQSHFRSTAVVIEKRRNDCQRHQWKSRVRRSTRLWLGG